MTMKKKLVTGLSAVALAAMCFGGTAFAADKSVDVKPTTTEAKGEVGSEVSAIVDGQPGTWTLTVPADIQLSAADMKGASEKAFSISAIYVNATQPADNSKVGPLTVTVASAGTESGKNNFRMGVNDSGTLTYTKSLTYHFFKDVTAANPTGTEISSGGQVASYAVTDANKTTNCRIKVDTPLDAGTFKDTLTFTGSTPALTN